jgi:hypothetical protein
MERRNRKREERKNEEERFIMKTSLRRLGFYSLIVTILTFSLGFTTSKESTFTVASAPLKETALELKEVKPAHVLINELQETAEEQKEEVYVPEDIQGDSLPYYQVNSEYLNVRLEPNSQAKITDVLVKGWIIDVEKVGEDGWYLLRDGGYINGKFVDFLDPMKAIDLWEAQKQKEKPKPVFAQPKPVVETSARNNINTNKNETRTFSENEIDLLARLVRAEARGESFEGKVAVANVVLNRIASGKFPSTIHGVIYQSGQFSPVSDGSINRPADSESRRAAEHAIASGDGLNGSLYFYNPRTASSRWLDGLTTVAVIGAHTFKK